MTVTEAPPAARDDYPSRGAEARILPRRDPVVYGRRDGIAPGPLTPAQLDRFERDGFLKLPKLFSEVQVKGFLEEMERLRREGEGSGRPEVVVEPESHAVRSVFDVHRQSEPLADLVSDPRLLGVASQILGSDVYLHQTRLNYKPAFRGKEFFWHSDFETWHTEDGMARMRALSCTLLLYENNEVNGSLMMVPGSHHHYVACVGETPERHYETSLRRQEFGVPDDDSLRWLVERGGLVSATGAAGSVLIFDCNVMHGSNSNISPWPRSNLFFVYNSVENRLVAPFCGRPPRPNHIANRLPEVARPTGS